jgi:hypothetical protein
MRELCGERGLSGLPAVGRPQARHWLTPTFMGSLQRPAATPIDAAPGLHIHGCSQCMMCVPASLSFAPRDITALPGIADGAPSAAASPAPAVGNVQLVTGRCLLHSCMDLT